MTVKELIEKLRKFPPQYLVMHATQGDIHFVEEGIVKWERMGQGNNMDITEESEKVVFLE